MSFDLEKLADEGSKSSGTCIEGFRGSSKGLFLAELAKKNPNSQILAITRSDESALTLADDCKFFMRISEKSRVRIYPSSEITPYSRISPEPELWAERIAVQSSLLSKEPAIVIASSDAIIRRIPPKSFIERGSFLIENGKPLNFDALLKYLSDFGYDDVGLVEEMGCFAKRGGIIDVWSPTLNEPLRIELDSDIVISIRPFNPASQRSKGSSETLKFAELLPVSEIPFDEKSRSLAAHRVRDRSDTPLTPGEKRALIESIHEGIAFSGIENLTPLFHKETATVFDYLAADAKVVIFDSGEVESSIEAFSKNVSELYHESLSSERIVAPEEILINSEDFFKNARRFSSIFTGSFEEGVGEEAPLIAAIEGNADIRPMIAGHKSGQYMLSPLVALIRDWQKKGWQVVLNCHTAIQAQRLGDLFHTHGVEMVNFESSFDTLKDVETSFVKIMIGRLSSGFRWPDEKIAIVTDEEIFGEKISKKPHTARASEPFTSFAEIADGDLIVHEQHGIGRYRGLVNLTIEEKRGDYMLLEYLGSDKLYLPVYRLNLVGKYIGSGSDAPMLDKLGGIRWSNVQAKARREVGLIARELLKTYAERKLRPGFSFPEGGSDFNEFCAAFPYDETPDQTKTIEDVMRDMGENKPSDRLICGDVGYGKTEVAMRAAYRAIAADKQVAILVPTTVLALQHYENFLKRFAGTPASIGMLSRFRSKTDIKNTLEKLKTGAIDIAIGTHRILQDDVRFKNLGLLIIDEEHRFGVKHKERIKQMKSTVDVFSMTATPIPRTLNMSLMGIRDISVINTPPVDRQAVATYVTRFDEAVIRQAILKELARGGQIFFVHNRVETIGSMFDRLKGIIPEAKILLGHGKMREGALEKVMIDFLGKRADVLFCTTIIESGLDIPNANTIIVDRADTFGLAQLYQLRGRVGRSNIKAFAYLLTPDSKEITPIAKKRLSVLKRFTELGSGFQIAMHDLEFRGAGNILGSAQSGHINAIGYELYVKLLDRTVRKLKGAAVEEEINPELNLKVSAFLPEDYVPDTSARVELYRRLASREETADLEAMAGEISDRFGTLPKEAINLLSMMEIKIMATKLKIRQINFDGTQFSCQFDQSTPIDIEKLLKELSSGKVGYRIYPPDKLLIVAGNVEGDEEVLSAAKNSLSALFSYVSH